MTRITQTINLMLKTLGMNYILREKKDNNVTTLNV